MNNQELQSAISYLEKHPEVILRLRYPASKGPFAEKTFGDIYDLDAQNPDANIAAQAIQSCKNLYLGKNTPAYAAALILAAKISA